MELDSSEDFKLSRSVLKLTINGLWYIFYLLLLIFLFVLAGYFIQKNAPFGSEGFPKNMFEITGALGNSINGIFASVIGAAAVLTTFLAFVVQYQANQRQRKDIRIERFETKFYEMLKLHKQNVNEIDIANRFSGRKAFVKMFYEYHFLYHLLYHIWSNQGCSFTKEKEIWLSKIAYHYFFFGVDSKTVPRYDVSERSIEKQFINEVRVVQSNFEIHKKDCLARGWKLEDHPYITRSNLLDKVLITDFYPIDGHVSRLGHYFRHLYQMVKFVADSRELNRDVKDLGKELLERKKYIKLIRAQLSNHEQALLYWNSFWITEDVWWEDKEIDRENVDGEKISYFLDYHLIKNLPYDLVDENGPNPRWYFMKRLLARGYSGKTDETQDDLFNKLNDMFEWKISSDEFKRLIVENPSTSL